MGACRVPVDHAWVAYDTVRPDQIVTAMMTSKHDAKQKIERE